jgi:hypothetical protein
MSISAMKQALEALEDAAALLSAEDYSTAFQDEAITTLRQAIAEAEKQEPVAWEGIRETVELRGSHSEEYEEGFWAGLRAYEDKLREQDWYGQHQWQCGYERGWDAAMENRHEFECPRCGHCCQQREWVGLTDEEIMEVVDQITTYRGEYMVCVGNAIEAKLKKKNT